MVEIRKKRKKETLSYTDTPTAKHTCTQNKDANMSDLIVDKLGGKKEGGWRAV